MNKPDMYILVYPESHEHLGLFSDLEDLDNVQMVITRKRNIQNGLLKWIRRFHTSWTINRRLNLPLKNIWYESVKFDFEDGKQYCVIYFDLSINYIDKSIITNLCYAPNVRCVLVCINSLDASSIGMLQIRKKIFQIPWDDIYSFDPGDREKYKLKDVKNCYYSCHEILEQKVENDVFFAGGLKGEREEFIFDLYRYLKTNNVKAEFYISAIKEQMLHNLPFRDEINYYTGGWKPYKEILEHDLRANVIIEIVQKNQTGPSLRYYEAVCYNRKLITTNKRADELPYFNPEFMKIIEKPEDIDLEWVKSRDNVDYKYKGDFSPVHLLEVVLK